MKEITKEKIKLGGMLVGSAAGYCVSAYVNGLLTALCPPIGVAATIGKFTLSWVISTKCSLAVSEAVDGVVDGVDDLKKIVDDCKKITEKHLTQEDKATAT